MSSFFAFLETRSGRLLRYGSSVALIATLLWLVDWKQALALRGFVWAPIILGLLLAGATYPLHALRWWILLRAYDVPLSLRSAHAITWIGQFYNSFLLGGLGGDAARVYYVCRDAPKRKTAGLATVAMDRVMGLLVLLLLALAALLVKGHLLQQSDQLRWLFWTALSATVLSVGAIAVLVRMQPARWPAAIRARLGPNRMATAEDLLHRLRNCRRATAAALAVSVAIWLGDIVAIWIFAHSVALPLPLLETAIAVAVAYTATALPLSVGGHGVREGALLFTLGLLGLLATEEARDRALLVALLMWASTIAWSLIGGLVLLGARQLVPGRPAITAH